MKLFTGIWPQVPGKKKLNGAKKISITAGTMNPTGTYATLG